MLVLSAWTTQTLEFMTFIIMLSRQKMLENCKLNWSCSLLFPWILHCLLLPHFTYKLISKRAFPSLPHHIAYSWWISTDGNSQWAWMWPYSNKYCMIIQGYMQRAPLTQGVKFYLGNSQAGCHYHGPMSHFPGHPCSSVPPPNTDKPWQRPPTHFCSNF